MQNDMKQAPTVSPDGVQQTAAQLFYTMLPTLVQSRIPAKLRGYIKHTLAHYQTSPCHTRALSHSSVDSTTPPPSYRADSFDQDSPRFSTPFPTSYASSRPSTPGSATPSPPYEEESDSGINWRYAEPGFSLLTLASQEETALSGDSQFTRRQYVAGVTCMLRGLPTDLSPEEMTSLRGSLPTALSPATRSGEQALIASNSRMEHSSAGRARQSMLHYFVATATLYLFLAMSFIVPYIQLLLKEAYRYDRRHKVSDRVLAQSLVAADSMGKRTLTIASNVCAMNDGKVGETMRELGTYVMQGLGGGVYDGVGEGMQVIGLRASESIVDTRAGGRRMKSRSITRE